MPRAKSPIPKKPAYRPQIAINWQLVEEMITSGCSGPEIAGAIGVCSETFYERFVREKGMGFSAYAPSRKTGGLGLLRNKQFQSAMRGNTVMLKTLGEELLGQGKKDQINPPNENNLSITHDLLKLDKEKSERIKFLEERLNVLESKADPIIPGSEQTL